MPIDANELWRKFEPWHGKLGEHPPKTKLEWFELYLKAFEDGGRHILAKIKDGTT